MIEPDEIETEDVVRQLARIADALERINATLEALRTVIMEFE